MLRFFKLIFSRFFIIAISIILQFLCFVVANFYLSESFIYFQIAFNVLAVIVFLIIINKHRPASFKLTWASIILLVPIFGITLYLTFGNLNLSKKVKKIMNAEWEQLKDVCQQEEGTMSELRIQDEEAYGQARYIENTCLLPTYHDSKVEYLKDGLTFWNALCEELEKAEKYILMEYFIIEKGTMWTRIHDILLQKIKEGVEVHFMYDDVGSISKVKKSFAFELRNEGIYANKFNPFKPIVSVIHNNRDHRKITVIDGKVGFIGGANIADEYINVTHPFGEWKDNALRLKGHCVDSLIHMFIQLYNINSLKKIQIQDYLVKEHVLYEGQGFCSPYADGPQPIYKDYVGQNVYLHLIGQAKRYLYITTPYLIVDYEMLEAIANAAKRGVDVRIITPHIPDKKIVYTLTRSNYKVLLDAGVKIYEYKPGFIHAKTFIIDDKYATVGTINLDYRSLVHHFECGVWMYNEECILDIKEDLLHLFDEETILMDKKSVKLNFLEWIIKLICGLFAPML